MQLFHRILGDKGPFLVILHGLFGSSDNWLTLGKTFAKNGFRVVLTDLRNHGLSEHNETFDLKSIAEDLTELLSQLSKEKTFILGHSLGGKVAMQLAVTHPEMINGIIVADIGPMPYQIRHEDIVSALQSVDTSILQSRKEAEEQLSNTIPSLEIRQWLLKNLYWKEKNRLDWRFNLNVIANNLNEVIAGIESTTPSNVPALFLRGELSDYLKESDLDSIKNTFANASMQMIPHAGHWLHADNPKATLEHCLSFMELLR
jgi:esterase